MLSHTLVRRVEWGDCDPAGIVFNPQYFRWFDHGTTMLYEAGGWPKPAMLAEFGGAGCPIVETRAAFRMPCTYGDDVRITSEVTRVGRSSFEITHTLTRDGEVCVEGFETRVWTVHGADGALRSAPLPDALARRFRDE